ncbi:protein phosphatase 2C domain-containing protein [Mesorhizobium sp. M1227]|uniref:PP2C family protein-serine/threonine phosphatase n=1 Tax=Mesorhizobium sp. M1227 TaxID=2957071 RepID=UPI0033383586
MFREKLESWLSRRVPDRAVNLCFDLPAVLATDIGLHRSENQDRVAAMKISSRSSAGRPLTAVAVADGMGGMRDGGKCATIAMSSFFYALTLYRFQSLEQRVATAILHANDSVFELYGGNGGATLSAVLIDHKLKPVIVNIGDSRIYSFGNDVSVERLTVDDSLAEAVGGHGRDLLQFIGMGPGIQPHINAMPNSALKIAITTDGIHFLPTQTFNDILSHASDLKSAAERLAALARWCGGSDNASSALVDTVELSNILGTRDIEGIQLWDPFGSLQTLWVRGETERSEGNQSNVNLDPDERKRVPSATESEKAKAGARAGKSTEKKPRKPRKQKAADEDLQFEIEIESSEDPAEQ